MTDTEIPMDAKLFERYRRLLPKNNGFAQNADALLRQVEKTLAHESVCTFVTREDNTFRRVLLPFLVKNNWVLEPQSRSIRVNDSVVRYLRIIVSKGDSKHARG